MKITLLKYIKNLGKKGDIVEVKPGYLRNFLIHNNYLYDSSNNKNFINNKNKIKIKNEINFENIYYKLLKINEIIFYKKSNKNGKLFGSINSNNIFDYLKNKIYLHNKKFIKIYINKKIRNIGVFSSNIILNNEYNIKINIIVKNNIN